MPSSWRQDDAIPDVVSDPTIIIPGAKLGVGCLIARDVEIGSRAAIGDYSYVNAGSIVASGAIGKFCSIGYYSQIGLPEHPTTYISTSPRTYGAMNMFGSAAFWNDYPAPPIIENDVWIGSQVLVLQHVHIGTGAVVAGGAVVTGDVPPYTIVAGVPAKPIRQRFDDAVVEQLLRWRWWDLPIDELRRFQELFELREEAPANMDRYIG